MFGVQQFHSYLFGHRFELITDHQPPLALLHEHHPISPQASASVRHRSLLFSPQEYKITFRKTQEHQNADALSRLPLLHTQTESSTSPELVPLMDHLDNSQDNSPVFGQDETLRCPRCWTMFNEDGRPLVKNRFRSTVVNSILQG